MKKEKQVKSYQRRTKSGKTVVVKAHTAKYDAAEEKAKNEARSKKGAGDEFKDMKGKVKPLSEEELGFTQKEFAEWYNGTGSDVDKKVEKALKKHLGKDGYKELNNHAADNYRKGGHKEMFSNLGSHFAKLKPKQDQQTTKEISSTAKVSSASQPMQKASTTALPSDYTRLPYWMDTSRKTFASPKERAAYYKAAVKKSHDKLTSMGYRKYTHQGTTFYHKSDGTPYGGNYRVVQENGKIKAPYARMKEYYKAKIAKKNGAKYTPKNYK